MYHNKGLWSFFVIGFFLICLLQARHLTLKSDFKDLLPETKPSVIAMDKVVARVGGVDTLMIGVESDDPGSSEKFIEALATELKTLPKNYIRSIDYNVSEIKTFFDRHKHLYVDLADLRTIRDRLKKKIDYEKLRQNPMYISLEDEPVEFDISDLEEKYRLKQKAEGASAYDHYTHGYYFSQDQKLAALVIRPFGTSTGIEFAKDLITRVKEKVAKLEPSRFHSSMKIHYAGSFAEAINEYDQIAKDMFSTVGLCLLLVSLAIYLYFWRLKIIPMLVIPTLIGVVWTFALTKVWIGSLNSQTAFLASILIGNGINTGIIILARYLEERKKNVLPMESMGTALETTWVGTLCSAVTTSAAFACLLFSEVRGLSHFGFIGGIGMILTWASTMVALPLTVFCVERVSSMRGKNRRFDAQWDVFFKPIAKWLSFNAVRVSAAGILFSIVGFVLAIRFLPNSLEYDFSKLSNKTPESETYIKINNIFGEHTSPSIVLLDHEDQSKGVCEKIMAVERYLDVEKRVLEQCKTIDSFIPEFQQEKIAIVKNIKTLLEDDALNFVKREKRRQLDELRNGISLQPVTVSMLPDQIKRGFTELDGSVGKIAYVYPKKGFSRDSDKVFRFSDVLDGVTLDDGSKLSLSGTTPIFSDILKAIKRDGPLTSILSFAVVILCVVLMFRKAEPSIYMGCSLLISSALMFGLQSLTHTKLNFFNFIAIPMMYGIGVDYSVNLYQRYMSDGKKDIMYSLSNVGGAILLCALTTMISYITLLGAKNQAVESFGYLALFSEIACISAALIFCPVMFLMWKGQKNKHNEVEPKLKVQGHTT